jgi:hypothetical protein
MNRDALGEPGHGWYWREQADGSESGFRHRETWGGSQEKAEYRDQTNRSEGSDSLVKSGRHIRFLSEVDELALVCEP